VQRVSFLTPAFKFKLYRAYLLSSGNFSSAK